MNVNMTDDVIFSKVGELMERLAKNQQLQNLAEQNGLDIKNTIKLTDDTVNNIAVSVIAMLLAKRDNDSRYNNLVQAGIQKRSIKTDIINTYKDQANQMINKYKDDNRNELLYKNSLSDDWSIIVLSYSFTQLICKFTTYNGIRGLLPLCLVKILL